MANMDESCWRSLPASKRASHVIIIGFLCVSLAAGLSNGGEFKSRREHTDSRHLRPHDTMSSLHRDVETQNKTAAAATSNNDNFLEDLKALTLSSNEVSSDDFHYSNNKNRVTEEDAVSLLTSSTILSKLTASSKTSSRTSSSSHDGLRVAPSEVRAVGYHHHIRDSSPVDASPSRRLRRASNRGNHFLYNPKATFQLFCRTGYRLAVHPDGTINGTQDHTNIYSILLIQSRTRSYVSMKGVRSKLYVCVDDSGNLFGSESLSVNCFFQESLEPNFYNTYAISMHSSSRRRSRKTHFLSVNKDGVSRLVKVRSQKKAQFIPLPPPRELL